MYQRFGNGYTRERLQTRVQVSSGGGLRFSLFGLGCGDSSDTLEKAHGFSNVLISICVLSRTSSLWCSFPVTIKVEICLKYLPKWTNNRWLELSVVRGLNSCLLLGEKYISRLSSWPAKMYCDADMSVMFVGVFFPEFVRFGGIFMFYQWLCKDFVLLYMLIQEQWAMCRILHTIFCMTACHN